MKEKIKDALVPVVGAGAAIGILYGVPYGIIGAGRLIENLTEGDPQPSSCGVHNVETDALITEATADNLLTVSLAADGSIIYGAAEDSVAEQYVYESINQFEYLDIEDAEQRIFAAQSIDELRSATQTYLAPLDWEVNIGPDVDYPNLVDLDISDIKHTFVSEDDLGELKPQVAALLGQLNELPIELLRFADVSSINIFRSWNSNADGVAYMTRDSSTHISLLMAEDLEYLKLALRHEIWHAIDDVLCDTYADYESDESFKRLPNFAVLQRRLGDRYTDVAERRAVIGGEMLSYGGLRNADDPEYVRAIERSKRLLSGRLEEHLPGITDFFLARYMLRQAEWLSAGTQ